MNWKRVTISAKMKLKVWDGNDRTLLSFIVYKVNAIADKYNKKGSKGPRFSCKTSTCDGFGMARRFVPQCTIIKNQKS